MISAVPSPYTGLNATLTLTSYKYCILAAASTGAEYFEANSADIRIDRVPLSAVAVSSGALDAGIFELAFSGPRYMPLDGAGTISS